MADSSGQVAPDEMQTMKASDVSNDLEAGGEESTKEVENISKPDEANEDFSKDSEKISKENGHQESPSVKKSPKDFQKLDQSKMSRSTSHKFSKSSPSEKKGSSDAWSRVTGSDGTDNLPRYALPTVAFQLRVSLCQSADGLTDKSLPVCQRFRSDSPNTLSNFIKEQRSKSAESRKNQMEKMIELSQPTSRRSKTIPTSASNHTSASDSSTPHSGRSSKSPGKSLNTKSSLDDSLIGRKSKTTKETSSVHSTSDGKNPTKTLKKKTSSLDVLATPRSKEPRQPSASRQSPVKSSPSNAKGRDSSVHQQKVTKPKSEGKAKLNGTPDKGKDVKDKKKVDEISGKPENAKETEEYKAKLAEKRKQAREKAEEDKKKQEEEKIAEEEKQLKDEEEELKREEEELQLAEESKKVEEERLQKKIEEEDDRKKKEAEKLEKEQQAKREQEMKAKADAEKFEQERLMKIKKDEEEKLERKKRLENIMKRVKPDEDSDRKTSISSTVTNGLPENQVSEERNADIAEEDENTQTNNATKTNDGSPAKVSDEPGPESENVEEAAEENATESF